MKTEEELLKSIENYKSALEMGFNEPCNKKNKTISELLKNRINELRVLKLKKLK